MGKQRIINHQRNQKAKQVRFSKKSHLACINMAVPHGCSVIQVFACAVATSRSKTNLVSTQGKPPNTSEQHNL